jgi:hypothetical protein
MSYTAGTLSTDRGRLGLDLGEGNELTAYPMTVFVWVKEQIPDLARGVFFLGESLDAQENAHWAQAQITLNQYRLFSKNTGTGQGPTLTYSSTTLDVWLPHLYELKADADRVINVGTENASNTNNMPITPALRYFRTSVPTNINAQAGKLAHIAIWTRLLTTQEKADLLENNFAPNLAAPSGLAVYAPLTDNLDLLIGPPGTSVMEASGTNIAYDSDNPTVITSLAGLVPDMPALYEGNTLLASRTGIQYAILPGHTSLDGIEALAAGTNGTTDAGGFFTLPTAIGTEEADEDSLITVLLWWQEGSDPEVTHSTIFKTTLVAET